MPFAFGHLVGTWFFGKIYEFTTKKEIDPLGWFVLLLGGILPDLDHLVDWIFKISFHRYYMHTLLFALYAGLITYLFFTIVKQLKKEPHIQSINAWYYAALITFGATIHLVLDMFYTPGVMFLWPIQGWFSYAQGYTAGVYIGSLSEFSGVAKSMIVDMALGTAWIFWFIYTRKLRKL